MAISSLVTSHSGSASSSSSVPPRTLQLDPLIPVFRRMLSDVDLYKPAKTAIDCLDSGAFANVTFVSLKSIPHVYFGDQPLVKEFDNGMSCRLRYFEAAFISVASLVYNLAYSVVFSALSLVTLGQAKLLTSQMRKQWILTGLAVAALGVSIAGTVSPDLGTKANLAAGAAIGAALLQMQEDSISKICTAYQRHNGLLKQEMTRACVANGFDYEREFIPFFNYLDQHLNERVKTFGSLLTVVQGASGLCPSFRPQATPHVILDNLRQLATQWTVSGPGSAASTPSTVSTTAA